MICFNRPEYLKRSFGSIQSNDLSGFDSIHIFVEPTENQEMLNLLKTTKKISNVPVIVHYNKDRLFIDKNGFQALSYVFDNLGSSFNIHVEEDVILSPNATKLCLWYENSKFDPEKTMCLCMHNHQEIENANESKCFRHDVFNAYGWAATKDNWNRWLKPEWFTNNYSPDKKTIRYGWDWSLIYHTQVAKTVTVIIPEISRSTTIGELGGINMSCDFWRAEFKNHKLSFNQKTINFELR